jgi:hypothetical protein
VRSETNPYREQLASAQIEAGAHRKFVGQMWNEIGKLQFDFLRMHGLLRQHKLLDILIGRSTAPWTMYGGVPPKPIKERRRDMIRKAKNSQNQADSGKKACDSLRD